MTRETFYRKIGRRYHPVAYYDSDLMDSLPVGVHLLCILPGGRSFTRTINPDHSALLGALRLHRNAILDAIQIRCASTSTRPLTKKELAGLEAYKKAAGNDSLMLARPSAMAMVYALEDALIAAIGKDKTP